MQYRTHRYPSDCAVSVATTTGQRRAYVVNVSKTGARLNGVEGLQRGDKISIRVLSHSVDAIVLWSRGAYAGVTFRPAINDYLMDVLRKGVDGRGRHPSGRTGFRFAEMR